MFREQGEPRSPAAVDLRGSSQLSADELLERFRRYRGNSLLPGTPSQLFLASAASGRTPSVLRESHAGIYTSPCPRETKNYYLYALVGGGGFCSSQTKLAATTRPGADSGMGNVGDRGERVVVTLSLSLSLFLGSPVSSPFSLSLSLSLCRGVRDYVLRIHASYNPRPVATKKCFQRLHVRPLLQPPAFSFSANELATAVVFSRATESILTENRGRERERERLATSLS